MSSWLVSTKPNGSKGTEYSPFLDQCRIKVGVEDKHLLSHLLGQVTNMVQKIFSQFVKQSTYWPHARRSWILIKKCSHKHWTMQQTRSLPSFFISGIFYMPVLLTSNQIHKYCYLLYQICSEALERIFGVLSLLDRRGTKHSTSYHIPIYQHTMGKLNNRVKSKKLTIFPWILTRWSRPKTVPKTLKIKRKIKKWQILKNAKQKSRGQLSNIWYSIEPKSSSLCHLKHIQPSHYSLGYYPAKLSSGSCLWIHLNRFSRGVKAKLRFDF